MRQLMSLEQLGVVRSPQSEAVDDGWGEIEAEIHLDPQWAEGLRGLEGFSHAWILTWLHEAKFNTHKHLSRHPRDNNALPKVGIFAQRARHRPNRIGITPCPILSADPKSGILRVSGLDAIDGTPVVDIKPYVEAFDKHQATIPPWMQEIMQGYF